MPNQIQGFQLSPQQKRLWLLQQYSQSYCAQCAILIEGTLKVEVLKEALQKVVARNEILRTTFHRPSGIKIPIQVIERGIIVSFQEHNLENGDSQESEIEALFQEARERYLEFEKQQLLHTELISFSPQKYVLLVSLPALCADRVTLKNLVCEISQCYAACLQGEQLDDEPLQYADLAEWQNELLEAEHTAAGRKYWRQQDISALETLNLIGENQPTGKQKFEPRFLTLPIQPDVTEKIAATLEKYQTSAAVFFLTCWQILLWRLTGQSNVIVGIACDGRNFEELIEALGLFAKYLPLPCHLEEDYPFSEVLAQVKKSTGDISELQESFTWELIVETNKPGMELPFFPFCFEFEEALTEYSVADISFSIVKQYTCIDRFKVKLSCVRREDSLSTEFHYDAHLFEADDIQRLAEQFHTLLASAVNHPEAVISELEILSPKERQQLIVEFNNTKTDYPIGKCVHRLFEAQVERTPDAFAVVFKEQQLTYAELNAKANQLAHYLQQLGIGPEVLVGICVERSLEMVIGLLGILKAGGAYVPIDPTYPSKRKAFILKDTQAPLLLTQQHLAAGLPIEKIQFICIDTDWSVIAQERAENPISQTTAENLAYVIYTSGSTGKPKGTLIHHRGLVNYLSWCTQVYAVEQGAGTLVHSPLGFDLTITSLFSPLLVGRRVELLPENQGIETLCTALRHRSNLSLVKITPAHLELLSQQLSPQEAADRTRAFIIGGENLSAERLTFWQDFAPNTTLINEYGPTETVVGCCIYQVPTDQHHLGSIPIGHPIANTQLYVLNQHGQPMPIGVPGELHIGGLGLARGYLNRPELTAEKFIPNPLSDEPGERLYKTGDLVRYRSDGTLEYLGRLDDQVKIRGFRIELGEVEEVLSQHSGVREAVVIVREDVLNDKRLVAYVVPNQEHSPSPSSLRSFLQEKLPDYMVPSAFVLLKTLPLTPNGKVDRRALPAPGSERPELEKTLVAPRTQIEEVLAGIWSQILNVEQVGVYDNFFDLGGHSLLTTQLLAKVREAFQVDVSLLSLLEVPNVAGLAENIEKIRCFEPKSTGNSKTVLDLDAEAVLDSTIHPDTLLVELAAEPNSIFLTGATGFLGAFLLHELLQQTQADIYCLVRSANAEEGKKRLQSSLESYFLWDESLSPRIIPVAGNLSEPLLGLSDQQFRAIATKVDVIYHNGAWVNFIYPYTALKAANVLGTQEILRLASQIKLKPVHFISTTSVFPASGMRVVREQDSPTQGAALDSGYTQSKWVAEKLVTIAHDRGIPVSIYRPGRISGHSQTGVCNANDFLYKAIAGCIQLGSAPDEDTQLNIAPVDYVSRAIVHLSRQKESLRKTFHLINPRPLHLSELVSYIHSLGYPLQQVLYDNWRAELLAIAAHSPNHAIYSLVPLFPQRVFEAETPNSAVPQFDCQNTLAGLAGSSIVCPPVDNKLLHTYFSYLIQNGFLDAPRSIIVS